VAPRVDGYSASRDLVVELGVGDVCVGVPSDFYEQALVQLVAALTAIS
jgi:hypothetical protein